MSTPPADQFIAALPVPAGPPAAESRVLISAARARNAEVVGQVVDASIEASARARQQRAADEAERRAEEARLARMDDIERRERAEAEAAAEERRRVAAEVEARQEEDKARLAAQRTHSFVDTTGRLDASA